MKFSLVIPVAPDRGAEVVESLKSMDYPKSEFNVIIVKGRNPSNNRNKGSEKSQGEIIGFLDDDGVVDKDLLKNAERFFRENKEIDIVGGSQLTPHDDKKFAKISGYALSSKFGGWKMSNRYGGSKVILNADETMITSANLFCRKEVMKKIKFDSSLFPGEDPKFIDDAKKSGLKVAFSPNLIIYHRRRANTKGLVKQIFNYGKVRPAKESLLDTLKKPFFIMPSLFLLYVLFAIGLLLANLRITGGVVGIRGNGLSSFALIPLVLYILLSILFAGFEAVKNKDFSAFFVLPFVFPMIHLSYGAGMIYGYIKKLKKEKTI